MKFWLALVSICVGNAFAQRCDSGFTFTGPIVITSGGTYSGNWESTDATVPAVMVLTREPVIIQNARIRGPGPLLTSFRTSVFYPPVALTVQQSCFIGVNPNVAGASKGKAFDIYQPISLLVQFCDFESTGFGVYVDGYRGNYSASETITVRYNRFHNIDGRISDGVGAYDLTQPGSLKCAIQLNHVLGVPGIELAWNQIVEDPNQSRVEDTISLYLSSGTPDSPIQVHDNYIHGSYTANAAKSNDLKFTGEAINTDGESGTTDPSQTSAFIKIHDNQAVSVGFDGIGISCGHDIELFSNRVVSNGQIADGTNITRPYGYGITHHNFYQNPAGVFGNNSIHDNLSGLRRQDTSGNWERADYSFTDPPAVTSNNQSWSPSTAAAPTLLDEAAEWLLWNKKQADAGVTIGSALEVQAPVVTSVSNAFADAFGAAPNAWLQVKGTNLAPPLDSRIWGSGDFVNSLLPTALDGASVTVNGKNAFVYYISSTQINILSRPDSLPTSVPVQVTVRGAASNVINIAAQPISPAFFTFDGVNVTGTHLDGSLLGPTTLYPGLSTPAKPGETVVLFGNGFGPTSSAVVPGSLLQSGALPTLPQIGIQGSQAQVTFAGLIAPGLFQFNIVVPDGAPDGNDQIRASYGGITTVPGLLAVHH